jgi:hypothetical protein
MIKPHELRRLGMHHFQRKKGGGWLGIIELWSPTRLVYIRPFSTLSALFVAWTGHNWVTLTVSANLASSGWTYSALARKSTEQEKAAALANLLSE